MICGTTSDAGKSTLVTALCRQMARRGVRVAPFKAQNMALNSYVTPAGAEIGRAQGVQALAAGIEPDVAMNPILLKPTAERTSQVIVNGAPIGVMTAAEYHAAKPDLLPIALGALADLRSRFDVVVCEGAGSPAEINLLDHDVSNLRIAAEAGLPALVVGDIDRGGVFAALFGTVELLPARYRALVRGFVINKLRGDPALLFDGTAELERRTGVPTLGVLPMLPIEVTALDAEDSLALDGPRPPAGAPEADGLDVAVVRLPWISNVTDVDAFAVEPGVTVRLVRHPGELGRPDLVVLPGSKSTVADLAWLRAGGFPGAILASGADVLGICAGLQMLGEKIDDAVESSAGVVDGLGWLPVRTVFEPEKTVRRLAGAGYEIHHGRVVGDADRSDDGRIRGTTVHGLFESDEVRRAYLRELAARRGKRFVPAQGVSFEAARQARFDALADAVEAHLDLAAIDRLIAESSA
jgi:adenosylcobyric acid synthase